MFCAINVLYIYFLKIKAQTNVLLALTNVLFLKPNILEGSLNILLPVVYMNRTKLRFIYVAPYSRPVPYSRHPPYSRHFFNDTHENDCVWALFPIAVSGDHFYTQVCKEILSILSIFFGEAS